MRLIYSNSSQTALVIFLMLAFCMAGLSCFFITEAKVVFKDWQIALPSWAIPLWAFTPIWTFFYLFLAIAQWVSTGHNHGASPLYSIAALGFWLVQIALSGMWTVIFYADPLGTSSMLVSLALLASVLVCVFLYSKMSPYLSIVIESWYFLWCCYLTVFVFFLQKVNN